jgi:hypothetical protein
MNELTKLANIAEIVGALIVIGGLFFALMQMRQIRQQRRELAAIELFRFFGNPDFTRAYKMILRLPEDLSAEDIRNEDPALEDAAVLISATMENIGVMTYQRIVPFIVVNNLMGGTTPILWRKLRGWTTAVREEQGSMEAFEWFQWLSERLEQYASLDPNPAYVSHRDWVPAHLRNQIGS